jgi:hypothetical protein
MFFHRFTPQSERPQGICVEGTMTSAYAWPDSQHQSIDNNESKMKVKSSMKLYHCIYIHDDPGELAEKTPLLTVSTNGGGIEGATTAFQIAANHCCGNL